MEVRVAMEIDGTRSRVAVRVASQGQAMKRNITGPPAQSFRALPLQRVDERHQSAISVRGVIPDASE